MTAAYIAQQRMLTSTMSRDLLLILRAIFSTTNPGQSWPATKMALDALIRDRRRQSAGLAARYYVDLRRASPTSSRRQRGTVASPGLAAVREPRVRIDPGTGRLHVSPPRAARRETPNLDRDPGDEGSGDADFPLEIPTEQDAWDELERLAGVGPDDADGLNEDRLDANLNATGIATFKKAIRAGRTPEQASGTMATNLSGAATRLALEGGREVVRDATLADEDAVGWARIPDEFPCGFCAMLVSRGAVYRSARTAGINASKKFVGDSMFRFHNWCQCTAVPVFDPDDPVLERADELYDDWLRVTAGKSGDAARAAWEEHWAAEMEKKRRQV